VGRRTVSRPHLTVAQRVEVQRRVASGEHIDAVAAAFNRTSRSVYWVVQRDGGLVPRTRPRSPLRLSPAEREEISRGLLSGASLRGIAVRLGRAPSTVSREVAGNGGRGGYRAWRADARAQRRARRPKPAKLACHPRLRAVVEQLLEQRWSPQQIAHRLRMEHPADEELRVSHETIYQSLFVQGRGALRRELTRHLRSGRILRRARQRHVPVPVRDMVLISARPAEVDDRAVPGHWEGDLLMGGGNRSAIATLVERQTRFVLLVALPAGRQAPQVRDALAAAIRRLPTELRRTLTWDRGNEMAEHLGFSVDTGVAVYFCDQHSPWQRGSNENTNGLLRQYFPKGSDLSIHDQAALDAVARQLNDRPRQTLGWMKPSEKLAEIVALID
jgi:IS30 family transposase